MGCLHCAQAKERALAGRIWPGYAMSCTRCCARLLRSARPLRTAQEAMLACITRRPGRPTRADVLQALKALDAA